MKVNGIRTTTVSIPLTANVFRYKFATNRFLGMGADVDILGITCRVPVVNTSRGYEGTFISRATPFASLTLKDKSTTNFLNEVPLIFLYEGTVSPFQLPFFGPIKNNCIDWIGSFISIDTAAPITTGDVIEFTIYYHANCGDKIPQHESIELTSGVSFSKLKASIISIDTEVGKQKYPFQFRSSIEIPVEATIIGFIPNLSQGWTVNGKSLINNTVQQCSFITIKKGDSSIINQLPYNHRINPGWGWPYFPIEPIKVENFSAQQSEIYCSNVAAIANNESYQFLFYYIEP